MKEGEIISFVRTNGGSGYNDTTDIVIEYKAPNDKEHTPKATFRASEIRSGIITSVEVIDGGKEYSENTTFNVGGNDVRTPTNIKITDIDDNHIEAIELVDPGSGFSLGDQTVNVKDATFSETIDITTSNQYGNPNESILCILDNLDGEITKSD